MAAYFHMAQGKDGISHAVRASDTTNKGEKHMQTRIKIKAVTREKDAAGKFQTNLTPNATIEGNELVERWARFSRLNPAQAETTLVLLKGFILEELAKGNKLDFDLVSFYPRLSGALSSRDSSPDAEGLYVRGAVKARRPLMNGLKDRLEAVNGLATVRAHIYNVFDKTANRFDVLAAGHLLSVSGYEIPVDATKKDEGVWLERRAHKGYERVAKGRIVGYAPDLTEVVFDEEIARGTYVLAFYTRCGHGDGYRVVRVSRKIRAIAP
jgi:hypothetical protein